MFSTLSKRAISILNLSSVNGFNKVKAQIVLIGKGLRFSIVFSFAPESGPILTPQAQKFESLCRGPLDYAKCPNWKP